MLPEWVPNIHPLVVHFPIALLIVALLADLAALAWARQVWLGQMATALYVLGAIGALAAFFSGREASNHLLLPAAAESVLTEHADWAGRTVWGYALFALGRLGTVWLEWDRTLAMRLFFIALGVGGASLLFKTGEHGAQLVYQHGVGVQAVDPRKGKVQRHEEHERPAAQGGTTENFAVSEGAEAEYEVLTAALAVDERGNWSWPIGPGGERVLQRDVSWLLGGWSDIRSTTVQDESEGTVLALELAGAELLLVAGEAVKGMQVDLRLNQDTFAGQVAIVHHAQDARNYYYLMLEGNRISLGAVRDGTMAEFAKGEIPATGWLAVRVVGAGTHFKGYIDDDIVVHGHGPEPLPGRVGLALAGSGTLMLSAFEVEALR